MWTINVSKKKSLWKLSWENAGWIWIKQADMCTNTINVFVLVTCTVDEDIFSEAIRHPLFPWWSWLWHSVSVCVLNGVYTCKQLYLESHDGAVDLSFMNIRSHGHSSVGTYTHSFCNAFWKMLLSTGFWFPALFVFHSATACPLLCLWLALTLTAFSNYHTSHLTPPKHDTLSANRRDTCHFWTVGDWEWWVVVNNLQSPL